MGKKAPKPRILINPHTGEAVKVITNDLADKLQPKEDPNDNPAAAAWARTFPKDDDRSPEEQALDDFSVRRAVLLRMFDAVRNRARTDAEVLLIAKALFALEDWEVPAVSAYLNWDADLEGIDYGDMESVIVAKLDALPPAEVAMVATLVAIEAAIRTVGAVPGTHLQLAHAYGVDVLAVRDKVAEDLGRSENEPEED
jgi:hypothetical protein